MFMFNGLWPVARFPFVAKLTVVIVILSAPQLALSEIEGGCGHGQAQDDGECRATSEAGVELLEETAVATMTSELLQVSLAHRPPNREGGWVNGSCLCIFDVDRTLTGAQRSAKHCPRNKEIPGVWDSAYAGGILTLSALASEGLGGTFCNVCYLGIITAGSATGWNSPERKVFSEKVLKSSAMAKIKGPGWCNAGQECTFITGKRDRTKQEAVPQLLRWYAGQGVEILGTNVFFFGDRRENIPKFAGTGYNAKEISCGSRDYTRGNAIGYCGATPEEIKPDRGITLC
jgi:hypothetical protein